MTRRMLYPFAMTDGLDNANPDQSPAPVNPQRWRRWRRLARRLGPRSTLLRRILAINILALAFFLGGLFYIGQFREELVEVRVDSLTVEAMLVAGALGEAALAGAAQSSGIDVAVAKPILRNVVATIGARGRLFGTDGTVLLDSRVIDAGGRTVEFELLPPPDQGLAPENWPDRLYELVLGLLPKRRVHPIYEETGGPTIQRYPEVAAALRGEQANAVRRRRDQRLVINVAVPIQPFMRVHGALMLTVDSRDIDAAVRSERLNILKIFALTIGATALLSLYLAGTIARPIRRLAAAAERVRTGYGQRAAIPDFTGRRDEIGDLSGALRVMTDTLYQRMAAIEAFAVDVSHELKNPLTSLRSAVETLERTDNPDHRRRLLEIILDDVGRLDRLISDISDASRVDAEMSRTVMEPVDVGELVQAFADVVNAVSVAGSARVEVVAEHAPLMVDGIRDRLGQVLRNLVDNAQSFSPPDGVVTIAARRLDGDAILTVSDSGPGFPADKLEAVFERFYSDRPEGEAFGVHSGLGLSICRRIVEAHGGWIRAENRLDDQGRVIGACLTVGLPPRVTKR